MSAESAPVVGLGAAALASIFLTASRPPAPQLSGPRVTDAYGVTARLDAGGRGVVLLDPLIGEYMIGSRAPASLRSIGSWNLQMVRDSPLATAFPALLRLAEDDLWRHPNVERLLALRPSAVIPYTPLPNASAVGLPVIRFQTLGDKAWWLHNAPTAARLAGQPDRAAALLRGYEADISALRRDVPPPIPGRPLPTVLPIAPHMDQSLGGRHEWVDPFLQLAGGKDPALGKGLGRLNPEQLIRLDPDVLVLGRTSSFTPAQFMAESRWRILRAVRERRVYAQPPGLAFTTTGILEYPIYARWLAELLHPDSMRPALRSVMRCAYARTLGYRMGDDELDRLLALRDNSTSQGYARFARQTPSKSCEDLSRAPA